MTIMRKKKKNQPYDTVLAEYNYEISTERYRIAYSFSSLQKYFNAIFGEILSFAF